MAEQSHRGEHGDILAEAQVDGRLAAAQAGVVHAGHVVEKQRGGMDHLQRAGRIQTDRRIGIQIAQCQQKQQRPEPLSRSQGAFAQGLGDGVQLRFRKWQAQRQSLVDLSAQTQQVVALRKRETGVLRLHGVALAAPQSEHQGCG